MSRNGSPACFWGVLWRCRTLGCVCKCSSFPKSTYHGGIRCLGTDPRGLQIWNIQSVDFMPALCCISLVFCSRLKKLRIETWKIDFKAKYNDINVIFQQTLRVPDQKCINLWVSEIFMFLATGGAKMKQIQENLGCWSEIGSTGRQKYNFHENSKIHSILICNSKGLFKYAI